MAMESACNLQVGRDRFDGKVRMDGAYIDFSGPTKFRFRLAEIRKPRRSAEAIRFDFHGTSVCICLNEKTAERWIDAILNPQSLADKLGVKAGQMIRLMNIEDGELLSAIEDKQARVVSSRPERCDIVMLGVERPAELRQLSDLSGSLRPGGAIWVVLPKAVRTVTRANVTTAAREAGLSKVKVVDYSETQAAYKITRPDSLRGKRRKSDENGSSDGKSDGVRGNGRRAVVKA